MIPAALVAVLVSVVAQPFVIAALRRRGALDHPTERSSHAAPTPRGGGAAVVAAILLGGLLGVGGSRSISGAATILAAVGVAAVLGLAEDLRGVPVRWRAAGLTLIAVPLATVRMADRPGLSAVVAVVAVVYVVAVVNAVNFMDGINGITAAQGIAGGTAYAVAAHRLHQPTLAAVAVALAAASVGFVPYNVPRARVFLGDCGSYGVGTALAGLSVIVARMGAPLELAVAPLAIYLADTGTTLLRRMRAGEDWYRPHRTHVYQRLTDLGWPHAAVSAYVFLVVSGCAALGAQLHPSGARRLVADAAILVVVTGYLLTPRAVGVLGAGR